MYYTFRICSIIGWIFMKVMHIIHHFCKIRFSGISINKICVTRRKVRAESEMG